MISCLQKLHDIGIVHRDIKPGNIVMGIQPQSWRVFLIDFGTSRKYVNPDGTHVTKRDYKRSGTIKYASLHTHKQIVSSRRDDLESLAYTLIYLYQGKLPWDSQKEWENVQKIKEVSFLVKDKNLPDVLFEILTYARKLSFDQKPDYSYLRRLCRQCLEDNLWPIDFRYEWTRDKSSPPSTAETSLKNFE